MIKLTILVLVAVISIQGNAPVPDYSNQIIEATKAGGFARVQALYSEMHRLNVLSLQNQLKAAIPISAESIKNLQPIPGGHVHGEAESAYHSWSNVNGQTSTQSAGHKVINDDGRVTEFNFKPDPKLANINGVLQNHPVLVNNVKNLQPVQGGHVYGEAQKTFHSATSINGQTTIQSSGHKVINNDGHVTEYDFKPNVPVSAVNTAQVAPFTVPISGQASLPVPEQRFAESTYSGQLSSPGQVSTLGQQPGLSAYSGQLSSPGQVSTLGQQPGLSAYSGQLSSPGQVSTLGQQPGLSAYSGQLSSPGQVSTLGQQPGLSAYSGQLSSPGQVSTLGQQPGLSAYSGQVSTSGQQPGLSTYSGQIPTSAQLSDPIPGQFQFGSAPNVQTSYYSTASNSNSRTVHTSGDVDNNPHLSQIKKAIQNNISPEGVKSLQPIQGGQVFGEAEKTSYTWTTVNGKTTIQTHGHKVVNENGKVTEYDFKPAPNKDLTNVHSIIKGDTVTADKIRNLKPPPGGHVYGEAENNYQAWANVNGQAFEKSGGHKIVNDDGTVMEFSIQPNKKT